MESDGFLARRSAERDGGSRRLSVAGEIVQAALTLGGAVVERTEGAVIVVDREYRAGMLHGRIPIGDIASVINDGTDAMTLMAQAWPSAKGIGTWRAGQSRPCCSSTSKRPGLFGGAGTQAFLVGCAAIDGDSIRVRQFLLPGFEHERAVLAEMQAWARTMARSAPTTAAASTCP